MNGFNYNYDNVVIETPEERAQKRRTQRRLFSRVFFALFMYIALSFVLSTAVYVVASMVLPQDVYAKFAMSTPASIIVSCVTQYLIAFPIFLLCLIGTKTAEKREKKKLSLGQFILFFAVGESLMYLGNIIGIMLNNFFGSIRGSVPENDLVSIINETPIYLIFIMMVILAPIFEELICRKLIIDRLSVYGDHIAIGFSAIAFGLLHENLYQFFYATMLGVLLGYIYTYTRQVKYTVIMHMIINFMGSIVVLPIEKFMVEFDRLAALFEAGEPVNLVALAFNGIITLVYSNLQYGMMVAGVFVLVHFIRQKKLTVSHDKEIFLQDKEIIKGGIVNVGSILFISLTVVMTLLNLILS